MNFKALRAFSLVMEFGSITAAADKLHLSTPAVSRLIGQLEAETRLKLFNRTNRGLSATEAGHLFMKEAQRILTDLDELPDVIRKIKRHSFQRLSILTTPRLVPGLVIPALASLSRQEPDVRCSIDVQPKWELERSLTRNRYDLCIAILPVPNNALAVRPLYRIASGVLMPKSHRLASHSNVTPADLQQERLIGFLPGQFLRRQVTDLFRNAGIEMEFSMEISNSTLAADLTRSNCGLSVVDGLLCAGTNMAGLTFVPFQPRIWTTAGLLRSKDEIPTAAAESFANCIEQVLQDFVRLSPHPDTIELFGAHGVARPKTGVSRVRRDVRGKTSQRAIRHAS